MEHTLSVVLLHGTVSYIPCLHGAVQVSIEVFPRQKEFRGHEVHTLLDVLVHWVVSYSPGGHISVQFEMNVPPRQYES